MGKLLAFIGRQCFVPPSDFCSVLETIEQARADAFVDFMEACRAQPLAHDGLKSRPNWLVGTGFQHCQVLTVVKRFRNGKPIGQAFLEVSPCLLPTDDRVWVDLDQPMFIALLLKRIFPIHPTPPITWQCDEVRAG